MKLTWIGHACFRIEKAGYALIIDPYKDGSCPGLYNVKEQANEVLCSHEHGDHAGRECVALTEAPSPITVEIIETYHDDTQGSQRGPNKIFLLSDGIHRVAHCGDLGCQLEGDQLEKLKGLDALMVPVGGHFTINGAQAAALVREVNPRMVIPMHYRNDDAGTGFPIIGTVEDFTSLLDSVQALAESTVDTDKTYPAQVLVLKPGNQIK